MCSGPVLSQNLNVLFSQTIPHPSEPALTQIYYSQRFEVFSGQRLLNFNLPSPLFLFKNNGYYIVYNFLGAKSKMYFLGKQREPPLGVSPQASMCALADWGIIPLLTQQFYLDLNRRRAQCLAVVLCICVNHRNNTNTIQRCRFKPYRRIT